MAGQLVAIQAFDANGTPVPGAKFRTFVAGTTTPQPAYADEAGTIPLSNPITLNASGIGACWFRSDLEYKFDVLTPDLATVLLRPIDNFTPNVSNILYIIGTDVDAARDAALDAQEAAELAQSLAETAATNAAASAGTATTQAGIATTQAGIATTQAGTATTQAGLASDSATRASRFAIHPEDTAIPGEPGGTFSALHWAAKAADQVDLASAQVGLAEDARDAAIVAQGLSEDARDASAASAAVTQAFADADVDEPVEGQGVITFNPATAVNTGTDKIAIASHGLENSDPVTYRHGGGTAIGGLTHDMQYWVVDATAGDFSLAATRGGAAINLTSAGTGSAHELLPVRSAKHHAFYSELDADNSYAAFLAAAAAADSLTNLSLGDYANASAAVTAHPDAMAFKSLYFHTGDNLYHVLTAVAPSPASIPLTVILASQAEAEDATNNTRGMSPLRTQQSIHARAALYKPTRAALKAIPAAQRYADLHVHVTGATAFQDGWEGVFVWRTGDRSADVTADGTQNVVAPDDASTGSSGAWYRVQTAAPSAGDGTFDRVAINGAPLGGPLTLRSTGVSAGGNTVLLEGEVNAERITIHSVGSNVAPQFQGRAATGSLASPGATASGARLFGLGGSGHDGTNFVTAMGALISINADAAWTGSSHPTRITFATTPSGAVASNGGTERMRITPSGDVGINITAPTTRLHVDGPIRPGTSTTANLPSASTVGAGAILWNSTTNALTVSNGSGWLSYAAAVATTDLTTLAALAGFGSANDRELVYVRSLGTHYEYRDSLTDTSDDLIVVTSAGGGNKKFGLPTYLKGQGIDLTDLGVDLTGATDMYSVILKAVNAAKARGGMVKFPGHGILRLATQTSIDIAGVALVGVGKADRNLSDPDASVIQIRQTAVSPFTAGDGTVIDGLSFDYPNQTDSSTPTAYAALIDGSNWRHGGMVNTHVMRAWQCATLGGASGSNVAGSLYFYDNRLYCIDKDFRIRAAPEFIRMSRNHFSQNAFEDFSFPLLSAYTRLNGIGIDVYGASSTAHGSVDGLIVDRTNFIYGKRTAFAVTDGYLNISHVGGMIDYCERWFQCQSGGRVANSIFEGFGWADNDQNSLLTAIELGSTVDAVNSLDIVNTTIINGGGTAVAIINDPAGASHKTTVRISSSAFRDFGGDNLSTDRHGVYCENSKATVIATGVHIKGRSNETAHIGVFATRGKVRLNGCTIENLTYPVWAGGTSEITVKGLDVFDTKTGGANSAGATYFQSETGKVRVDNEVATSPETTGTLTNASANKTVICSGGITLPNSVFKAGDIIMFDPGTSNRTFTRGSGIAMYRDGTDSASATLSANKMGMVYWRSASVAVLSGGFAA